MASFEYFLGIFSFRGVTLYLGGIERYFFEILPLVFLFYIWEWLKREKDQIISTTYEFALAVIVILIFEEFSTRANFIYFQF